MSKSIKSLIKQNKSLIYTNSLELAEYLGVEHFNLFNAIKNIDKKVKKLGVSFLKYDTPFILQDYIHPQNSQKFKVYFITLEGIIHFFMNYTPRKRKGGSTYVKDQYKKFEQYKFKNEWFIYSNEIKNYIENKYLSKSA